MKWYKHDANANMDAKLRRLRLKYGMEGYGLYWYCLELIAQNVEKHNLSFQLEHDAEVIAHDTDIHYERVQEMMVYMVDLGLFENQEGVITCLKLQKRTDEYTQKLINQSGGVPTISRQSPDKVRSNRTEQTRTEQKPIGRVTSTARFEDFWKAYPRKVKKKDSKVRWRTKKLDTKADKIIADVEWRIQNDKQWREDPKLIPHPTTYLSQERWDDEREVSVSAAPFKPRGMPTQPTAAELQADREKADRELAVLLERQAQ